MDKVIRIFVSSTFRDLIQERKWLRNEIIPILKNYAASIGIHVCLIDLSWGITTEEAYSKKVLERCLREIDKSRPFFLGIIGANYGWVPEEKDICMSTLFTFPFVKDLLVLRKSITEMEMIYGALGEEKIVDASFFISNSINESNSKELLALTNQIEKDKRYKSHRFSCMKEFENFVIADFKQYINKYSQNEDSISAIAPSTLIKCNTASDIKNSISSYLSYYGKALTNQQLEKMADCMMSQSSQNLLIALETLISNATFETTDEWIDKIISANTKSDYYKILIHYWEIEFGTESTCKILGFIVNLPKPTELKDLLDMSGTSEYMLRTISSSIHQIITKEPDVFFCCDEDFSIVVKQHYSFGDKYSRLIQEYYLFRKCVHLTYNLGSSWMQPENIVYDLDNMAFYYDYVGNYRQAIWFYKEALAQRSYYDNFMKDNIQEDIDLTILRCAELYLEIEEIENAKKEIDYIKSSYQLPKQYEDRLLKVIRKTKLH